MRHVRADGLASSISELRLRAGKDAVAGLLLVGALLLPWNLSFGVGVPGSSLWLYILLVVVTVSSTATLTLTYTGGRAKRSTASSTGVSDRARLALNLPYLLTVVGFVAYAMVQAFRFGGTGDAPPGVGPGLLAGLAGAVLVAQPEGSGVRTGRWFACTRLIAASAAVLATAAVLANLYWRMRFPMSAMFAGVYAGQSLAVIATTVVYAVVAWTAAMVALRWSFRARRSSQLATTALGVSTIVATSLVWLLGVGRDVDAFHGIAQTTSTTGVGFEGYVAWVAVAAIAAPRVLRAALIAPVERDDWRDAMRKSLALIAVWSGGAALLRAFDAIVAVILGTPYSLFDTTALLAFDAVAATVAVLLRVNVRRSRLHPAVLSAGAGVLFVLMTCRLVVGVGLAPRIMYSAEPESLRNAVYGNTLLQQITSTFDVVLALLALALAATSVVVLQRGGLGNRIRATPGATDPPRSLDPVATVAPVIASTTVVPTTVAVSSIAMPAPAAPRIARSSETATRKTSSDSDRKSTVSGVLAESSRRFAAGTTYSGTGQVADGGFDGGDVR